MKHGHRLGLFFVIVLSILVRAPGMPWGITQGDYFEPDEWQQVGVAKNPINTFDRSAIGYNKVSVQWYARGFGTQLGLLICPCAFNRPLHICSVGAQPDLLPKRDSLQRQRFPEQPFPSLSYCLFALCKGQCNAVRDCASRFQR